MAQQLMESDPGTYALILELKVPAELEVGRLGPITFRFPFYIYVGSAFGPGGLRSRIRHHTRPIRSTHWHIDYLRQAANVIDVWHSAGDERAECAWSRAVSELRGASPVSRFGASDCRCQSHLFGFSTTPKVVSFRRELNSHRPGCSPIAYSADSGRLFQSKPATCSVAKRPPVPRDTGHVGGA